MAANARSDQCSEWPWEPNGNSSHGLSFQTQGPVLSSLYFSLIIIIFLLPMNLFITILKLTYISSSCYLLRVTSSGTLLSIL